MLIIRKIIKLIVTRCHILRLKYTKLVAAWGSASHPTWGTYNAPPDSLAGLRGSTSKGRERM